MRIHLAENLSSSFYIDILREYSKGNLLFSYLSCPRRDVEKGKIILDIVKGKNIIIDSGAFSAWTQKTEINIDEYIDFCLDLKKTRKENLYFVNLDVIPGEWGRTPTLDEIEESAQKGWDNMLHMRSKGINPIHVFHMHEDFKWLDRIAKELDYIGISPANDVPKSEKIAWLDRVFSKIKATKKTHGFGVTAPDIIYRYPWYSCDSISWKAPCMYGRSSFENYDKIGFKDKRKPKEYMRYKLIREIQEFDKLGEKATKLWAERNVIWLD